LPLNRIIGKTVDDIGNSSSWILTGNPKYSNDDRIQERLANKHFMTYSAWPILIKWRWDFESKVETRVTEGIHNG
jgi:hypothetical protein